MDTKITDIFYNLINSGISLIYNVNHKEGSIDYKVGEEIITLKAYQYIRGKEPLMTYITEKKQTLYLAL